MLGPDAPPHPRLPIWLFGAIAVVGLVLVALRPISPFEQDEVLFLRGVADYDVARHSPHPPGYPLFVGMGKLIRLVLGDPIASLQVVSTAAATASLLLVALVVARLGGRARPAALAAGLLLATPTFLYHSNMGFSDPPGAALALAAVVAAVALDGRPRQAGVTGALAAAALAVRPQLALLMLPTGAWLVWTSIRQRRWLGLLGGLASGVAVSALCWIPAVLATGATRFGQSIVDAVNWLRDHEANAHFPGAALGPGLQHWLIDPWGEPWLAGIFWLAVVAGAVTWWRRGQRRLVRLAGGTAAVYLLLAPWMMGMSEAVRYQLPVLPFLATLAAGVALLPAGAAVIAAAGIWGLAAIAWTGPTLLLRHDELSPAWACLRYVASNFDPTHAVITYDPVFKPHVGYVLDPYEFHLTERRTATAYNSFVPQGVVVFVASNISRGEQSLFVRQWQTAALSTLGRGYYDRCEVSRLPDTATVQFSSTFALVPGGWTLAARGTITLPAGAPPQALRVAAGAEPLTIRVGDGPAIGVPANRQHVALFAAGTAEVTVSSGGLARAAAIELLPLDADNARRITAPPTDRFWVVPTVAHKAGRLGTFWVTDLLVRNPSATALVVELEVLPSLGGAPIVTSSDILPGRTVLLSDVGVSLASSGGDGALHVRAREPFAVLWRTYDREQPHTLSDPGFWPPLQESSARLETDLPPLPFRPGELGVRSAVGVHNPGSTPATADVVMTHGSTVRKERLALPPGGSQVLDGGTLLGPQWRRLAAEVSVWVRANEPVHVFGSTVENDTNHARYVLPDRPR
jgi:hypothetical protein